MADSADAAITVEMVDDGQPSREARAESRGVPAAILVGAIAILVVLVSIPRFRAHALEANRADARVALDVIGAVVFTTEWPETVEANPSLVTLPDVIEATRSLRHRFPDARRAADSGQLVHHGYRFDTCYVRREPLSRPALVAWPNEYGRSGDVAYALTSDGALWGHANGGLWSAGTQELETVDLSDEGWVLLRRARGE